VKVYFAKQFAKLRETFFVSGEEMYIRSLARCISWSARGGKSGSNFCKTKGNLKLINILFNILRFLLSFNVYNLDVYSLYNIQYYFL